MFTESGGSAFTWLDQRRETEEEIPKQEMMAKECGDTDFATCVLRLPVCEPP
jgi:hypothetical protein